MTDVLADPRCDCRINRVTGLQCRDCPKRRPESRPVDHSPLALRFRLLRGLDIPTFLRRAKDGGKPPSASPGRCCED